MIRTICTFIVIMFSVSPALATTSIHDNRSQNFTIDSLPCPSAQQAVEILKEARVLSETFEGSVGDTCDSSQISKLIKLLFFLKALNPQITPEFENHEIIKKLRSPWQFFISSYNNIKFFESKRAVAAFDLTTENLLLTNFAFEQNPVSALATLIHEAAHGYHPDRFHALCHRGNLKHTLGACDEVLEQKEKLAGSYSYEFWFYWMLGRFDSNISDAAKKQAQTEALQLIANRFNYVHEVGQFNDLIIVLTEEGRPKLLDPLSKKLVDIGLSEKIVGGPTQRLMKDERAMGVAFLSEKNQLTSWEAISGRKNSIYTLPLEQYQGHIKNYLRGYNFQDKATRSMLLLHDGRVLIESTTAGERTYVNDTELENLGRVKSVEMLSDKRYLVLLKDGSIRVFENGKLLNLQHNFEGKTVQNIASSIMGFHFHLIDSFGKLWNGKFRMERLNPFELKTSGIDFLLDEMQAPAGEIVIKYDEGIGHRALLTNKNQIVIDRHTVSTTTNGTIDSPMHTLQSPEPIKDLVFLRTAVFDGKFQFQDDKTTFKKHCGFEATLNEPWMGRPLGVNNKGDLVAFELGNCLKLDSGIQKIELSARKLSLNPVGLRETELMIYYNNGKVIRKSGY